MSTRSAAGACDPSTRNSADAEPWMVMRRAGLTGRPLPASREEMLASATAPPAIST